ncbi:Phospholipase/carboxylesterase/thioesterase [Phycomyces nitens]|nr:Phospholipase/carboxylesterase/thioesterase [Phycomyces nitens]
MSDLEVITIEPAAKHTATVVWMHGLGDTGSGWSFLGKELSDALPHVKWIFPTAYTDFVSIHIGREMTSWFDVTSLRREDADNESHYGISSSVKEIQLIIEDEIERGIPANRVAIGGFSQGGALSLFTGLTITHKLAGIIDCSGWLPMLNKIQSMTSETNKKTPILMCHGDADKVVAFAYGKESAELLKQLEYDVEFKSYPDMTHSASNQEVLDISSFLKKILPDIQVESIENI